MRSNQLSYLAMISLIECKYSVFFITLQIFDNVFMLKKTLIDVRHCVSCVFYRHFLVAIDVRLYYCIVILYYIM